MPETKNANPNNKTGQPTRLYVKAAFVGYQRNKDTIQKNGIALLRIQGLNCREDVDFYKGKRVAFVYTADTKKRGKKFRVIWGKVRRAHGNGGLVRATFRNNLPPAAIGASTLRVMLYPSRI